MHQVVLNIVQTGTVDSYPIIWISFEIPCSKGLLLACLSVPPSSALLPTLPSSLSAPSLLNLFSNFFLLNTQICVLPFSAYDEVSFSP